MNKIVQQFNANKPVGALASIRYRHFVEMIITAWLLLPGSYLLASEPRHEQGESKVEAFVEEVFLGEVVYPQDQGECQFTTGYLLANKGNDFLWGSKGDDDFEIPVVLEYGLTDYLQVAAIAPVNFLRTGSAETEGVGNVELDLYYNFFNDRRSGRAYGFGFAVGLPTATSEIGEKAILYEPYFIAYQQLGSSFALNFSAGIEIEDPLSHDDETEVEGALAFALMKKYDSFVFLTEIGAEIESDDTLLRLAPGLFWQPRDNFELGVSLPIGLTSDTPDLGVFVLMNIEFGGPIVK